MAADGTGAAASGAAAAEASVTAGGATTAWAAVVVSAGSPALAGIQDTRCESLPVEGKQKDGKCCELQSLGGNNRIVGNASAALEE
jgi:hypothetical protein